MEPKPHGEEQKFAELDKPILTRCQAIAFGLIFLLIWAVPGIVVLCSSIKVGDSGPFGDTFGTINALFSGAAFAGIIYTILLQRRELRLQRYELELTREELRRSAEAQEKSEQALNTQAQSLLLASQINAITSRIEAYTFQIGDAKGTNRDVSCLRAERHSLVEELDKLLQRASALASAHVAQPKQ
jgi:hypothetical protein